MFRRNIAAFLIFFLFFFLLPSTGLCRSTERKPSVTIFVSILPMVDFVRKVAGNRVRIFPLVLPGQSPATYSPTPKQMTALAGADLYFRIGVPFEHGLITKLQHIMPEMLIVDLRTGIHLIDEKESAAGTTDPHIWLDPSLVGRMAVTIRDALIRIDPADADTFRANCTRFQAELEQLDRKLRTLLQPLDRRTLYVFHPAYAYFCRAYNLVQQPVAPAGKTPGARHLSRIIRQARRDGIKAIFTQPQFSSKTAEAIAEATGATLIPLDPLAEDYIPNMEHMGISIASALNQDPQDR